jgi:hypothetical protein
MLYTNSQLLTQVEQEYYVNKTGTFFSFTGWRCQWSRLTS